MKLGRLTATNYTYLRTTYDYNMMMICKSRILYIPIQNSPTGVNMPSKEIPKYV